MIPAILTIIVTQVSGFIFVGAYGAAGVVAMIGLDVFMFAVFFYEIELKSTKPETEEK